MQNATVIPKKYYFGSKVRSISGIVAIMLTIAHLTKTLRCHTFCSVFNSANYNSWRRSLSKYCIVNNYVAVVFTDTYSLKYLNHIPRDNTTYHVQFLICPNPSVIGIP